MPSGYRIPANTPSRPDQREQAGLSRPGTSTTSPGGISASLKVPGFYMHRTPSTPSLMSDYMENGNASGGKETLAELWSNFLEQEAQTSGENSSKRGSTAGISSP